MHSQVAWLLPLFLSLGARASQGSVTDYAPTVNLPCPNVTSSPLVRVFTPQTQTLDPREQDYITRRLSDVIPAAWEAWLGQADGIGYHFDDFKDNLPKVAIALSGGGYRAAQFGAGVLSGLDGRDESAKSAGTGGLLQVASYLAGLSGGSWITSSLYSNGWPNIRDMVLGDGKDLPGWLLDLPLATPDGFNIFDDKNEAFYGSVLSGVMAKDKTGIDTSIVDPWSRMLSYHFLNQTNRKNFFTNDTAHGAGQLLSDLPNSPAWQAHSAPFPIIWANSRPVGSNITGPLPLEPIVYEFTPVEFGSWDPNLSAMVDLKFTGTHLSQGKPDNDSACVNGLDELSFVMGTSSSLFNQILDKGSKILQGFGGVQSAGLIYTLSRQLLAVRTRADDVANWPNPFQNIKPDTFEDADSRWLDLIDGGSNNENLPMGALLVRARVADVIVAVDASNDIDTQHWPNGSSLLVGQRRLQTLLQASHQPLPPIPSSAEAFIQTGVNLRPTFFGCEPTKNPPEWPLVIYFPNSPPLNGDKPVTNTDTFKLSYDLSHTRTFLDQAHANTLGGFLPNTTSPDPDFGRCLQCAAVDRARFKSSSNISRSDICTKCFKQYCFDPADPPSKDALPNRKLEAMDTKLDIDDFKDVPGFFERHKAAFIGGIVAAIAFVAAVIALIVWKLKRKARGVYRRVKESQSASYELPQHGR